MLYIAVIYSIVIYDCYISLLCIAVILCNILQSLYQMNQNLHKNCSMTSKFKSCQKHKSYQLHKLSHNHISCQKHKLHHNYKSCQKHI